MIGLIYAQIVDERLLAQIIFHLVYINYFILAGIAGVSRGASPFPRSPLLVVPPPDTCSADTYSLLNLNNNPKAHLLLVASLQVHQC